MSTMDGAPDNFIEQSAQCGWKGRNWTLDATYRGEAYECLSANFVIVYSAEAFLLSTLDIFPKTCIIQRVILISLRRLDYVRKIPSNPYSGR